RRARRHGKSRRSPAQIAELPRGLRSQMERQKGGGPRGFEHLSSSHCELLFRVWSGVYHRYARFKRSARQPRGFRYILPCMVGPVARKVGFYAAVLLAVGLSLQAQEEIPGGPPGRGGRGGRGGGGGNTREFLGLGPAPDAAAAARGEKLY